MLKRILLWPFYERQEYESGNVYYYRRTWFDVALIAGGIIGAVFVVALASYPIAKYLNENYRCPRMASDLRLRNEGWSPALGCMVEYEGKVVPVERLRWVR